MIFKKIKSLFKVKDNIQLIVVFIVFAITGSLSVICSDLVLSYFDINSKRLDYSFYLILRILVIFPIYQVLLIIVGTAFGEFKYFWEFEKKFLRRIGINLD